MISTSGPAMIDSDAIRTLCQPRITYLGHATTMIEVDGVRILTDPLLRRRTAHLRRTSRIREHEPIIEDPDVLLISHMHWDHLDIPSLRRFSPGIRVLGPPGSASVLRRAGLLNVTEMREGERVTVGSLTIEATPANHDGGRPPFGPCGVAVGYLVYGSSTVYFAGDTDLFDEMDNLSTGLNLALLPVWGWGPSLGDGHMNPERAAKALTRLKPEYAVPIHWGTLCPIGLNWTRPRFLTQPPRDFVQAANREAPDVKVRVIKPGGRLDLSCTIT